MIVEYAGLRRLGFVERLPDLVKLLFDDSLFIQL